MGGLAFLGVDQARRDAIDIALGAMADRSCVMEDHGVSWVGLRVASESAEGDPIS
jgi:hypothetical protein